MRDIRPALRSWLLGDASISSAVGGGRIGPIRLPQGIRSPSIVYNRISEIGDYHLAGPSALIQVRMQIDTWAVSQQDAINLADMIKDRMDEISYSTVTWGSNSPTDEIVIQGAFLTGGREDFDTAAEMYRMSRDYMIWYEANG